MAITLTDPNGGEYFYAHYNGSSMNTINNAITYTTDTDTSVNIYYSTDSGSNWSLLNTDTCTAGAAETYNWSLDSSTALTDGSGDTIWNYLNSNNEINTMKIRVVGSTDGTVNSAADFSFRKVSFSSLTPNHTLNTRALHCKSTVNITWTESYTSDIASVKIEYKKDGGSWSTLVASTTNDGSYLWHPAENPTAIYTSDEDNMQLRISAVDTGHTANVYYSENSDSSSDGFEIIVDPDNESGYTGDGKFAPERLDTWARIAGEKAISVDEALMLSQLEAGDGIILKQRDIDGKLTGDATSAPYKAFNVVIGLDESSSQRPAREKQGVFNMISSGTDASGTVAAGTYYYGTLMYFDVAHNWSLGDSGHACYISGQTQNSWQIEIQQISGIGSTDADKKAQVYDVIPMYETWDKDTVRVYCVIKGTNTDPRGGTVDSYVDLSKDQLGFDPGTYTFEYRLIEVIPYTTTCT